MPVVSEEAVPRFRTSASGERRGKVAEKEGEDEKTIGNQRLDFFYFFPREREKERIVLEDAKNGRHVEEVFLVSIDEQRFEVEIERYARYTERREEEVSS